MNIRAQVSILIAGIFVILGLAAIMIGKLVLMPSFAELERADARTAMRRIDHALNQALEQVGVASMDWGNWSDTYRFVQSRDPEFVRANITDVALRQLDVNTLLIVDVNNNVILARDIQLQSEQPLRPGSGRAHRTAGEFSLARQSARWPLDQGSGGDQPRRDAARGLSDPGWHRQGSGARHGADGAPAE